MTRTRASVVDFAKSPPRSDKPVEVNDVVYEIERFYTYPKEIPIYSMGQKREPLKQDASLPGPGKYEVDMSQTQTRSVSHLFTPILSDAAFKKALTQTRK